RHIEWKPAAEVLKTGRMEVAKAQEKAVDDLLRPTRNYWCPFVESDNWSKGGWNFAHLHPGIMSAKHRAALLFAAGEYERVAGIYLDMDGDQTAAHERCLDKAKSLRALAAKK